MAPSNDKEANGAGEQDADGEDGAVRGACSQVTGSGELVSPPRLGSAVAPEAFHTEGSVSTVLSTCTGRQRRCMAGTDGLDRCGMNQCACVPELGSRRGALTERERGRAVNTVNRHQ